MWLTYDSFWNAIYLASTYYLFAFILAIFFFLLVFFAPRTARRRAFKVVTSLFILVLVISVILFVAGIILFLGFVLSPQAVLFLSAFLPASAVALLSTLLLKRESVSPEVPVRIGVLPFVYAISLTVVLAILVAGAVYALLMSKPQVVLPGFEEVRKAVTYDSLNGSLPESFLTYVRTTEEFRTKLEFEERIYFKARKPFTVTSSNGTQVLISSTQELKELAPEKYKEFVEDYALMTFTAFEAYMPERLQAELRRYRQEERVVYAERNAEAIQPLLNGFAKLGLPSDLTPIQVADSLIRFAPQDSYRVDEVAGFVRGYTTCKTKKYFFLFHACLYQAADGTIYRIVER